MNVVGVDMAFCYEELERLSVACEIFGTVEIGVREVKLGRFDRVSLLFWGGCPVEVHAGCSRSASKPLIRSAEKYPQNHLISTFSRLPSRKYPGGTLASRIARIFYRSGPEK